MHSHRSTNRNKKIMILARNSKIDHLIDGFGRNVALVTALGYCQLTIFLTQNVSHIYVTSHGESWPQGWNTKNGMWVTGHFCSFSPFFTKTATNHARIGQFSSSLNPTHWHVKTHLHYTAWRYFEFYFTIFGAKFKNLSENRGFLTENLLRRQLL